MHFQELDHSMFIRDDLDIYLESEIQFPQAVLGTTIEVPTLSGDVKLKIPANVKNRQILRLKGKGMKKLNGHQYGDQCVRIVVNIRLKNQNTPC